MKLFKIFRDEIILRAIIVAAVGTFLFSSCGTEAPEITKSIPDDAAMVFSMDMKNFSDKVPKGEFEKTKLYEMFLEELENAPPAVADMMKGIVSDFSITGISQEGRLFGFNHTHNDMMYFCFLSELSDPAALEEIMGIVSKESGIPIEKKEALTYLAPDDEGIIAWTPKLLLVSFTQDWGTAEDNLALAEDLLGGKLEKNLTDNDNFTKFLGNNYDIGMWMDISQFFDLMKENMPMANIPFFPMPGKDSYSHSFINFEKGEVVAKSKSFITGRMNEIVKFLGDDVDASFIDYVPAKNLIGLFAMKINLESVFDNPNFGPIIGEAAKSVNLSKDEITNMLGGDMLLSWNGFQEIEIWEDYTEYIPKLFIGLKINDMDAFNKLFELVNMQMNLKEKDGYYVAEIDGVPAYMVKTEDAFLGGMDEEIIKNIAAGEKGGSSDAKDMIIANAKSNSVLMHFDASAITMEMLDGFDVDSDEEKAIVKKILDQFEYLDVAANGTESKSVLSLTNKDDNSLLAFMKLIDSLSEEVADQSL